MARVDIRLSVAFIEDIDNVTINAGQSFTLLAVDPPQGGVRAYANNDPSLSIDQNADGTEVVVLAEAPGEVDLQYQHGAITGDQIRLWKRVRVKVVANEASNVVVNDLGNRPRTP